MASNVVSTNIFAALDTKKKKKASGRDEKKKAAPKVDKTAELEKAIFAQPINALSSWADESDEEDYHQPAPASDGWASVRGAGGLCAWQHCMQARWPGA